jgi:hypothetical protein
VQRSAAHHPHGVRLMRSTLTEYAMVLVHNIRMSPFAMHGRVMPRIIYSGSHAAISPDNAVNMHAHNHSVASIHAGMHVLVLVLPLEAK